MKKILLIGAMAVLSSLTFAGDSHDSKNDIIENRLEVNFQNKLGKDAEIDVEIYNEDANVEIEYDGSSVPKTVNMETLSKEIANFVKAESKATDIFVSFKVDPMFGEDKVVYAKSFKNN